MGLLPLKVAKWGPFVLLNFEGGENPKENVDTINVGSEWLGSAAEILSSNGIDTSLDFLCRRVYTLECNWKVWPHQSHWNCLLLLCYMSHQCFFPIQVFCDNYLDGGYHVPYAHKGLASGLQLDSYSNEVCLLSPHFMLRIKFSSSVKWSRFAYLTWSFFRCLFWDSLSLLYSHLYHEVVWKGQHSGLRWQCRGSWRRVR